MSNGPTKAEDAQVRHQEWVNTREYFERLISEKDKFYEMKFRAHDTYYNAKLEAMEKATAAAFISSEKAISKAEDAQKELNIKNNEFRGQLKDQADILMPRLEHQAVVRNLEEKIEGLRRDVSSLREFRSESGGRYEGIRDWRGWAIGFVGLLIGLASLWLRRP